jgi:hypothetical protein
VSLAERCLCEKPEGDCAAMKIVLFFLLHLRHKPDIFAGQKPIKVKRY